MPDLSFVDIDNQQHSLAQYQGKPILMIFWATDCPGCIKEIPELIELHATYAEQASAFLVKHGINTDQLITIPTPASAQDRTYLSAVIVRDWFSENKPGQITIDLYSGDVHARRSYKLYKMAFADTAHIGIIAAEPNNFSLQYWWRTSAGAKSVLAETAGLIWINCCFSPGAYGSHQEKWGIY